SPSAYDSALAKKLTPASYATARQSRACAPASWGPKLTHEPNDSTLTLRPDRPSRRYVIPLEGATRSWVGGRSHRDPTDDRGRAGRHRAAVLPARAVSARLAAMRAVVICESWTGNTGRPARLIADEVAAHGVDVSVYPITDSGLKDLAEA